MVNKSLIKLIDEALLPAILLIIAKMGGLFMASLLLGLKFTVVMGDFFKVLPTVHFLNPQDYVLAENYSNLAMFLVASLGCAFILLRAHFFHESHIRPRLHSRLVALNLESLIVPSYHLYHQATVWLLFLWLTVGFLIMSTILGVTYAPISLIAFIIAANFSWILTVDIQKEVEISQEII